MLTVDSIKNAALDMARRGFHVFPLLPNAKVPFEWRKDDPSKRNCSPKDKGVLAGGIKIATRDEATIERWFAHELDPDFEYDTDDINYGVAGAGQIILDVDVKGGKPGVEDLLSLGALPQTFTVSTPTGGMHLYFAGGEAGQKPLTKAIDIRSRGGYVVGPRSLIDDVPYIITDELAPATIPEFLFDRLKRAADPNEKTAIPVTDLDKPAAVKFAIAFAKKERPAGPHGRNNLAFILACQLKDFGLSAEKIFEVLNEHWNARNEHPGPLEEGELKGCCERAFSSGRYAPGVRNPAVEFEDLPDTLDEIQQTPADMVCFDQIIQGRDPDQIPARPWLVPGLLIKSSLTAIVAQPGARKSTFAVGIAVGFALGTLEHMGFKLLCEPTDVLIINNEDDEDEIDRRIAACCTMNGLDYHTAKKRIHLHKPPDGSPFVGIGPSERTGRLGVSKRFLELKGYVSLKRIGLVIFDPLADIHHAQENDNSEMAQVMSSLRSLARSEKMAGLIIHHAKKPGTGGHDASGDPFSARGASAIHGNVRVLATLCSATEEDGFKYLGVSPPAHLNYSRFDSGKGSYSPPGKHTKWYLCEGKRVGPIDSDDTAPALRIVDRRGQIERLVYAMHEAIREKRDLFDKEGEMPITEAAEIVQASMPEIDFDTAIAYVEAHFRAPVCQEGVTFGLSGAGKKAKLKAT